jgi:hypothetical protein
MLVVGFSHRKVGQRLEVEAIRPPLSTRTASSQHSGKRLLRSVANVQVVSAGEDRMPSALFDPVLHRAGRRGLLAFGQVDGEDALDLRK